MRKHKNKEASSAIYLNFFESQYPYMVEHFNINTMSQCFTQNCKNNVLCKVQENEYRTVNRFSNVETWGWVKCELRGARCEKGIVQGSMQGNTRLVDYK